MSYSIQKVSLLYFTLIFFSLSFWKASAQEISRFDFNSTATLANATIGPNALSVNPNTVAPNGIAYIASGCGHGVGLDMEIPGNLFSTNNIQILTRFQRASSEGTGYFLRKGTFRFGFQNGNLSVTFRVMDPATGSPSLITLNSSANVSATTQQTYEFRYDNCSGLALLCVNGSIVASQHLAPGSNLNWNGGNAFVGLDIDNGCSQHGGMDYIRIAGNSSGCLTLLPVELGGFNAEPENDIVRINWKTLAEINNDYFEVEKSIDGITFQAFAWVDGTPNSTNPISYETIDFSPFNGKSYYRLKQVDLDGSYSYSHIVEVAFWGLQPKVTLAPNPSRGQVSIQLPENFEAEKLEVFDLQGKAIKSISTSSLLHEYQLDLSGQAPGMYLVRLTGEVKNFQEKLFLQ